MHSSYSDGSDRPAVVVRRAAELGIAAIAISDHDTIDGVDEGASAAAKAGIEFLPATEISAFAEKCEVHVLGYGIRIDYEPLVRALNQICVGRNDRAAAIVDRLGKLGIAIDEKAVARRAGGGAIGRMHIAQELHALGHAPTIQSAFDKFIGRGKDAYVPKQKIACDKAIALIHEAGGVAIFAHPALGLSRSVARRILEQPFDGIEVYHTAHTPGESAQLAALAHERNLLITGGSDCHGHAKKTPEMGKIRLAYSHYERLRDAIAANQKRIS